MPVCRELGIGFVAFSPLSRGFLSGAVDTPDAFEPNDVRHKLPRFQGENFQKNARLVQRLDEMAREKGCSTPQLALAWLLAKGPDVVPIPERSGRMRGRNAAADAVALSARDVAALDEAFPLGSATGTRYPPESMRLLENEQGR